MPRRPLPLAMLVALPLACGEPAGPEPVLYESARFVLADYGGTAAVAIDSLLARLEAEFDRVGALLGEFTPPPTPIAVVIEAGPGIPFVTVGQNQLTHWSEDLAPEYVAHQLTHLYTRYARSVFIEEGLAVWVTEELARAGEVPNPFRGQSPHGWVALFESHGSTIDLPRALAATDLGHAYQGSSPDASAWQLFNQAGSFTRWLLDEHGRDVWVAYYATGSPTMALLQPLAAIEEAWLAYARAAVPAPLACEDALGTVGPREAFWCVRARGG